MSRLIAILLLLPSLTNLVLADGMRWVGYGDFHYGFTFLWEQGDSTSNELYYAQTNFNPNFFVMAGDIGEAATSGGVCVAGTNYEAFIADASILSTNYYAIAGNHDVANTSWACWTNYFDKQICWTNGNYIFIGIGSYWTGGTNGTIDDEDLDFMENIMTNASPTFTNFIVMSHLPVVPDDTFGNISAGYGLERLTNLFNYYNVVAYLRGHTHSVDPDTNVIPGTTTLELLCPSITRSFSGRGIYQVFNLTNDTLIGERYRTDTKAKTSSYTNTVPQYFASWPPVDGYYVATNGSDSDPGTIDQPFLTIQKGIDTATNGQYVIVGQGTYPEDIVFDTNSGTESRPIIVDGQNVATVGSINFGKSYIHLQNFTVTGGTNVNDSLVYMGRNADFLVMSNNIMDGNYDTALNILIKWNGADATPFGDAGSDNIYVSNVIKQVRGQAVFKIFGDRNVFYGNTMIDSDQADWFQVFGRTNYFANNICSNLWESGLYTNHADFFQTFGDISFGSTGHIVESNLVIKMDNLAQLGNMTADGIAEINDITFRNNIFIGVSAKISVAMPQVKFFNNVFEDCSTNSVNGGALLVFSDSGGIGRGDFGVVMNNVFLNCGEAGVTNSGWYTFDTTLTNVVADYNFVAKDGYLPIKYDTLQRPVGDTGGWDKEFWWEDHGINGGNPRYLISGEVFQLYADSVLRSTGTNVSAYYSDSYFSAPASWDIGPLNSGYIQTLTTTTTFRFNRGKGPRKLFR